MIVSMFSLTTVSIVSYVSAADSIQTRTKDQLTAIAHDRSLAIQLIAQNKIAGLKGMMILTNEENMIGDSNAGKEVTAIQLKTADNDVLQVKAATGYENLLIANKHGIVIWAQNRALVGKDLSQDKLFINGIQGEGDSIFKLLDGKHIATTSTPMYAASDSGLTMPIGVAMADSDVEKLDSILSDYSGLGKTGETLIVGTDHILQSETRFAQGMAFHKEVNSEPIKECLENGNDLEGFYTDYRNHQVFGVSSCQKDTLGLVMVTKIDADEMNAPLVALQHDYIIIGIIISGTVSVFAFFMSRSISRPIIVAAGIAQKISQGDLTVQVARSSSQDEIGKLTNSFHDMIASLRTLVGQVKSSSVAVASNSEQVASSTEQMNSSVEQISATIQQISKGSQTQAQGLDQTNKVVEKLTRDMQDLAIKASNAADLTQQVGDISEHGARSATEADLKMSKIISVTDQSAKNVKDLAEKTGQITAVLDVIKKIADQTNLLALNAAIEAARAGDAGRGFAVVADEVKRLAEGSAKSSEEIDKLVKRIQEDAKLTVENIEGGSKEVAEGKIVIDKALKSLDEIAGKVKKVTQNVRDVAITTKNQVGEIEQVAKTANEIAAVSEENASATEEASAATAQQSAGTQEIVVSAQKMAEMADELSRIVSQFKMPESDNYKKIQTKIKNNFSEVANQ